jgi:hypothetical protein
MNPGSPRRRSTSTVTSLESIPMIANVATSASTPPKLRGDALHVGYVRGDFVKLRRASRSCLEDVTRLSRS